MAVRIQFRRGTSTQWSQANPILAAGELGYETDGKTIKFGDGQNRWNNLPVAAAGDIMKVKAGAGLKYGASTTGYGTSAAGDSGDVYLEIDSSVVLSSTVMDAKGDLLVGTGADTYTILPVGTTGQTLVADPATSSGVKWSTITDPTISNGYIDAAKLASNSVTTVKIANGAVTTDKLADGAVTTAKLADNAVTTIKITDANVTEAKLASNAVTATKIASSAVTTDKLAASAVTAAKVGTDVYQRGGTGFTPSSARIFIQSTTPTGAAGDIWFKY